MTEREIHTWPSEVLKTKAEPVEEFGEELQRLVDDMVETMYAAPGIGLAAPQVGVSRRLIVIDLSSGTEKEQLVVLANPEIVEREGEVESEEGCLSLPGLTLKICRAEKVRVRGLDRRGETVEIEAGELLGRALQHEIDHLDGVLLIDRIHPVRRELVKKKLKKALAAPGMKVAFLGTPDRAVPSLAKLADAHDVALVITQPDRPRGRGRHLGAPAVKVKALELGLPLWQPEGLRGDEAPARLAELGVELIVVVAYGLWIPGRLLELPPHGAVNLHFSLLPAYRGAAPVNWALINGEKTTGVTTFRLTVRMDEGPVYLTGSTPVDPGETAGELGARLAVSGADVLMETLSGIAGGTLDPTPQDEDLVSLAPKLKKTDGRIPWNRAAAEIVNLVRGVNPWPGAFTTVEGKIVKVWRAAVAEEDVAAHGIPPGTVRSAGPRRGLTIAAGEGTVALTEVQPEGKRRMAARDFLAGHRLREGAPIG